MRSAPRRLGAFQAILSVIVPPCCAACRAPCPHDEPLCPGCEVELPWLPPGCGRCGLPSHRARPCPAAGAAFDAAWAPFAFEGAARSLVHGLKLGGRLPLAASMAEAMAPGVPARAVLVPVPAAPARRRARGFDPAALLAAGLAARTGAPLAPVLRRRDSAPRQVGARRSVRLAGDRLRIEAVDSPPRLALLVDDVHTTGATLDACARALRDAGAERAVAVTFARTL